MTDAAKTRSIDADRLNIHRRTASRLVFVTAFVLFALPCMAQTGQAQEPDSPDAPPPLKILPKDEKNKLSAETDPKSHASLALELSEGHLAKAEELGARNEFDSMFKELGAFNAVIDEALAFIAQNDTGNGKILSSSKKLELGLRSYAPRLETLRRDVPSSYEPYVRGLIKAVREARSKAIEPFFGTSVLPTRKNN
ncbi:MAG TPA: hypothetical protein VL327_11770 [Pyrinomonadaceae bacterium]|jgi:hypothetical protein|nr:hypothetical protein [Pyrinomonadaceae bacterium]